MDALALELRLRRSPEVRRRKEEYEAAVRRARDHARTLTQTQIIERLIEHNPAYLRDLLETEDERFGAGALAGRYARTFYREFKLT